MTPEVGGPAPLVAHVVDDFEAGGLENGLINLVDTIPRGDFRHAVICVKGYSSFRDRMVRDDVAFIALGKRPGIDARWYLRLARVLWSLRPAIVHTNNLGTLEAQAVAAATCAAARVHVEHGRDVWDLHGTRWKYHLLRRAMRPCIDRYIAVSADLEQWLISTVGARRSHVTRIYNGVDTVRFRPPTGGRMPIPQVTPYGDGAFVIGTVGRMAAVKDQVTLTRAFLHLIREQPGLRARLRLAMVGEGLLRQTCLEMLAAEGAADLAWVPGTRDDIPRVLQSCDLFVLPSISEGTSNTLLEAMATGLPVVATRVGGTPELVVQDATGILVPSGDHVEMARAIRTYVDDRSLRCRHGSAGRRRVEEGFSLAAMAKAYVAVYDEVLRRGAHGKN